MKLKEKKELLNKIAELQKQVDNVVIENDNPFDVGLVERAYYIDVGYESGWYSCWTEKEAKQICGLQRWGYNKEKKQERKLNALLEKFAYENDSVVTEDMWGLYSILKFEIVYNYRNEEYEVECVEYKAECAEEEKRRINSIYFRSEEVAKRAIDEVVIPFMKEYDD